MKPTIVNHPLRVISLEYSDTDEPLSQLEQDAVLHYQLLHDHSYQLQTLLTSLRQFYLEGAERIKTFKAAFNKVYNEYILLSPLLYYLENGPDEELINVLDESDEEEFEITYDAEGLLKEIENFEKLYFPFFDEMNDMGKEYNKAIKMLEQTEKEIDDFRANYISPIFRNYKHMQIDICRLDTDYNNYLEAYATITKLKDAMCGAHHLTMRMHILLHDEMSALYTQISKLFDELIKHKSQGLN